jgi:hypothetical protein
MANPTTVCGHTRLRHLGLSSGTTPVRTDYKQRVNIGLTPPPIRMIARPLGNTCRKPEQCRRPLPSFGDGDIVRAFLKV